MRGGLTQSRHVALLLRICVSSVILPSLLLSSGLYHAVRTGPEVEIGMSGVERFV